MRRRLFLTLIAINILLGTALLVRSAGTQVIPLGIFNCCKGAGPDAYCCISCCWFTPNCVNDQGCREVED